MDEPVVQVVKEVLEFLEKTGNALISTGFPIAVKYVIATAIANITQFVVSVISGICSLIMIKRNVEYANHNDDWGMEGPSWTAVKVFLWSIMLIIAAVLALTSGVFSSVKMLIAPEWSAILNIIDLVK